MMDRLCFLCFIIFSSHCYAFNLLTVDQDLDFDAAILNEFSTSTTKPAGVPPKPEIKSMHITSNITNRYAHTLITSRVVNPANVSQEVTFSVIIPETAFITSFSMEVDGKRYKAYVKEKEEAKKEYDTAVKHGQFAAHVQESARDAERFVVSVNIKPERKVTFDLTYEELLQRQLGAYRHSINLNPGQIVPDMRIIVNIEELRKIKSVRANDIQSANEIDSNVSVNPKAQVELIGPGPYKAKVTFDVDEDEQRRLEKVRNEKKIEEDADYNSRLFFRRMQNDQKEPEVSGVAGKFVVEYDVERDPSGGEVIVNDGYFVHFFAPIDLPPMKKHVLFVLDVSGSMMGRKIEQLKDAMTAILEELKPDDYFNIIEFSYSVTVRNLDADVDSTVYNAWYGEMEAPKQQENTLPFPATSHYIQRAKDIVQRMVANGGTNINSALNTALDIAKKGVYNTSSNSAELSKEEPPQPIIIFLTDGEPTVGETRVHRIQAAVSEANNMPRVAIFSLAFGGGADFTFLKKLSLQNDGFARQIYEAGDAAIQLRNFYSQISSPVLANVTFTYPKDQVDDETITKTRFSTLFDGSEIVIAGKVISDLSNGTVDAITREGYLSFLPRLPIPEEAPRKLGSLERLWAYLRIRQLLDEEEIYNSRSKVSHETSPDPIMTTEAAKPTTRPKDKALELALKYSFVTPLTSLVVVKPEGAEDTNTESAAPTSESGGQPMAHKYVTTFSAAMMNPMPYAKSRSAIVRRPSFALVRPMMSLMPSMSAMHRPLDLSSISGTSFLLTSPPSHRQPQPIAFSTTPPPINRVFETHDSQDDFIDVVEESSKPNDLSEISWIDSVLKGDQLVFDSVSGSPLTLKINPPKNLTDGDVCIAANQTGVCRPLQSCVQAAFKNDLQMFLNEYRCSLPEEYAGVCCIQILDDEVTGNTTEADATLIPSTTQPPNVDTPTERAGDIETLTENGKHEETTEKEKHEETTENDKHEETTILADSTTETKTESTGEEKDLESNEKSKEETVSATEGTVMEGSVNDKSTKEDKSEEKVKNEDSSEKETTETPEVPSTTTN